MAISEGTLRNVAKAAYTILSLVAIAHQLGISKEIEQKASQDRQMNFQHKWINRHCEGDRHRRRVIVADKGWQIDPASIKVRVLSDSKKSSFTGVTFASRDSFVVEGRTVNHGDCFWLFKDARGSLVIAGTYREVKN